MKRIPRIPVEVPNPLRPPGTHQARPWDTPGTPLGPTGDIWGLPGSPTDYKKKHISTHLQHQKLSIAACESFCCNASPQRLPHDCFILFTSRTGTFLVGH